MYNKEKERKVIGNLSEILMGKMWEWDLTIDEMARRCDISTRKFCEIIYREPKGLRLLTLVTICENADIEYEDVFK